MRWACQPCYYGLYRDVPSGTVLLRTIFFLISYSKWKRKHKKRSTGEQTPKHLEQEPEQNMKIKFMKLKVGEYDQTSEWSCMDGTWWSVGVMTSAEELWSSVMNVSFHQQKRRGPLIHASYEGTGMRITANLHRNSTNWAKPTRQVKSSDVIFASFVCLFVWWSIHVTHTVTDANHSAALLF